jgi:hypothetical protein
MTTPRPDWVTSSFDQTDPADPVDLTTLLEHRQQCVAANGWRAGLRTSLNRGGAWVMGHMVTTLLALVSLIGVLLMWR